MRENGLGPNGALLFALESLDANMLSNLTNAIAKLSESGNYLLFDCPGQVELFTHQESLFRIFRTLNSKYNARLCVVSLVDSIYLTSASQYISITLLSLRSMLQLGLPQVNVVSKIDKVSEYNSLQMPLDYYTAVEDLDMLLPLIKKELDSRLGGNFIRLTESIAEMVESFGLVRYEVLAVEDKRSMMNLLQKIDFSNGYSYGTNEIGGDSFWREAANNTTAVPSHPTLQERWIDHKEFYDKLQEDENLALIQDN